MRMLSTPHCPVAWDYLHCRGDAYGRNVGSECALNETELTPATDRCCPSIYKNGRVWCHYCGGLIG